MQVFLTDFCGYCWIFVSSCNLGVSSILFEFFFALFPKLFLPLQNDSDT